MKKNDILVAASAKVAEYMAQGFIISWGDSSFGNEFRVDLERGDDYIRVYVDRFYTDNYRVEGLELKVVWLSAPEAFEDKNSKPIYEKRYYSIGRNISDKRAWFVESESEAAAAQKKRVDRYTNSAKSDRYDIEPSAALIRRFKNRAGFSNATRNNVSVTRYADGYIVAIRNRNGRITRQDIFKFKH